MEITEPEIIPFLKNIQRGTDDNVPDEVSFHTFGKGPATDHEIFQLEEFIGHTLPDEHKAILKTFGSCTFDGFGDSLTFFPVNELLNDIDPVERWDEEMKDTSIIGADNGGNLFFYDLINQTGRGVNSIFYCYPGNMSWEDSLYLGNSLLDVLKEMCIVDELRDHKKLYGKIK